LKCAGSRFLSLSSPGSLLSCTILKEVFDFFDKANIIKLHCIQAESYIAAGPVVQSQQIMSALNAW
jgi:hypothetical protein